MPPIRNLKPKGKKVRPKVKPYTKVVNPVSVGSIVRSTAPRVSTNQKSCRIKHREMMDLIVMSSAFAVRKYRINPGVGATFPWLSGQAQGWEQYKFHSLTLRYLPTCSTTEPGIIVLFTDYDPSDAPPTTVRDAMTNATATAGPVRNGATVVANPVAMLGGLKAKYIETQLSESQDPRSTDSGSFMIATDAGTFDLQIGSVWIEYDVELFYPQRATPSAFSQAVGSNLGPSNNEPFGVPLGGKIPTVGHLIHNLVGLYPNGEPIVSATPAKAVSVKNLVGGALYLINAYTNTTGSAGISSLTSNIALEGIVQAVNSLVVTSVSGTGYKNSSYTWKAPDWVNSATKAWVSVVDAGSVYPEGARVTMERVPDTYSLLNFA